MSKVKSYYDLLGISPEADRETILAAINELRKKDDHHSYASMLDNIELHLSDAHKRAQYNEFLKTQSSSTQEPSENAPETKPNNTSAPQAQRHPNKARSTTKSHPPMQVGNSNPSKAKASNSFSADKRISHNAPTRMRPTQTASPTLKTVRLRNHNAIVPRLVNSNFLRQLSSLIVLVALIGGLAFLGHRAYVRWQVHEQSTLATQTLRLAASDVEDFIRANHYFPEQVVSSTYASPLYTIELIDKNIVLTFTSEAADGLPTTQLKMESRHVPSLGLAWRCVPANEYPIEYLPAKCY